MALREILTTPHPALRTKARAVRHFDQQLQQLIDDMIETMRAAPGVGLAAPQVGVGRRVIVVEYSEESDLPEGQEEGAAESPPKPPKLYVVINPEITRHSRGTELGNEGCLSIPGYYGEVERYEWAVVKGLNRRGQPFRLKARGWLASIFQHEIDHLNGVLFIDRATQVWRAEEGEAMEAMAGD